MSIIPSFRFGKWFSRSAGPADQPDEREAVGSIINFDSMYREITGAPVSVDVAMRFTAVYAAIRLRTENIASLPKQLMQQTGKGKRAAIEHPVYRLIKNRPNEYMNIFSFWEFVNLSLDGWGNAYVVIKRDRGGLPVALHPIHPQHVTTLFHKGRKWHKVAGSKHYDGTYDDEDMLHFFTLSFDGIKGINPITYNAMAIRSGVGATVFGNEFFDKGGNIKAVLENDKTMSVKDFTVFSEKFNTNANHDTALLDGGWKYKSVGIAPEAAQMIQTRTFAIQDIARIFNVPPHMLGDLSRATFSNIEHQDIQFVKYSLRTSIKRYETEMERKLLFDEEVGEYEVKFNLEGLLRGDMSTRSAFYHNAILDGWLSRNEVREMENRNHVDGLDEYLYPANQEIAGKENEK